MKTLFLILSTAMLPWVSSAADGVPTGRWWNRPEIVERLSLTEAQQSRLDAVFRTSAKDLIDLRGEVEKRSIELHAALDQAQLSRDEIQKNAARMSEARNRLFERELMMLVDMRSVLTNEQWSRFRAALQSGQARRPNMRPREQNMRPGDRFRRR